jgi:hypothetical protein
MNFEKIQELNAQLPYKNIKGKNYIQVNQRVLAFRQLYPNGRIQTEIVKLSAENPTGATVIVKASVFDGEALISTGHAFENPGKNKNINQFSALENCETSAVGRALGFLGIGSTDSIASLEEIPESELQAEAIEDPNNYAQQLAGIVPQPEQPEKITPQNLAILEKLYQGASLQKLLDHFQLTRLEDMKEKTAQALLAKVAAAQKKAKKGN